MRTSLQKLAVIVLVMACAGTTGVCRGGEDTSLGYPGKLHIMAGPRGG